MKSIKALMNFFKKVFSFNKAPSHSHIPFPLKLWPNKSWHHVTEEERAEWLKKVVSAREASDASAVVNTAEG